MERQAIKTGKIPRGTGHATESSLEAVFMGGIRWTTYHFSPPKETASETCKARQFILQMIHTVQGENYLIHII